MWPAIHMGHLAMAIDTPVLQALRDPGRDPGSTCGTRVNNYPGINIPTPDPNHYTSINC